MAETWRARLLAAAGITKPVLIKKVLPQFARDESFIRMFISEARISATLSHGNIAQIFDFGEVDGEYFLAMEFVDGQPLHHVMRRAHKAGFLTMPLPQACFIALEMCRGLHYAHTRADEQGASLNIVHRDISPDNVIISYEGQVKLVDFGIAKAKLQRGFTTEPGVVKGKYLYFAPEQARGEEADARTDVWAVGVVLFEMVCGRLPLEGTEYAVLKALRDGNLPRPRDVQPELPTALESILLRALAVKRERRYESAMALGDALAGFLYTTAPRFSPMTVAYLPRMLFKAEMEREGRDTQLPTAFVDEVSLWRQNLLSAGTTPPVEPELGEMEHTTEPMRPGKAPREESPAPSTRKKSAPTTPAVPVQSPPARAKWVLGTTGVLACALGVGALVWSQQPETGAGPGATSPIVPQPTTPPQPTTAGKPPTAPVTPKPVARTTPAPTPGKDGPRQSSATWPVEAIQLEARHHVMRVSDSASALAGLSSGAEHRILLLPLRVSLSGAGHAPPASTETRPPLFYLLRGTDLRAQESLGVLPLKPLALPRGATDVRVFTIGPPIDDEDLKPRQVRVDSPRSPDTGTTMTVHPEWMTASLDKTFQLKGLTRTQAYRLTLTPVGDGAFTRGRQGGPQNTVGCVQDISPDALPIGQPPVSPGFTQRLLVTEGAPQRIMNVDALRCGFVDDDTSDNEGAVELHIEKTEAPPPSRPRSATGKGAAESAETLEKAVALIGEGQLEEAATVLAACLEANAQSFECHLLMGDVATRLHQPDTARTHYHAFLRLAPADHPMRADIRSRVATSAPP
ncbi:protein kinase [Myxococcus sp. K15C18031901]|nr:protein kinase [Myxococcus dinghuensis]